MNKNSSSGGMSLLSTLQIIFIVLKLLNLIDWTWGVVLIPFWIGLGLYVAVSVAWIIHLTNMDYKSRKKK